MCLFCQRDPGMSFTRLMTAKGAQLAFLHLSQAGCHQSNLCPSQACLYIFCFYRTSAEEHGGHARDLWQGNVNEALSGSQA